MSRQSSLSDPEKTAVPSSTRSSSSHHTASPSTTTQESKPSQQPPSSSDEGPPDGGTKAWLTVLGAWCTAFTSFGWLNSIGVFQSHYQSTLLSHLSPSTISWIPSLQIFFILGMGPFVGALYDRFGPRWLLGVGSVLHVFGVVMASLGREYYQILLSQGVVSAVGASMIFQPPLNCVGGWFAKKRGAAFGILSTGASIGGVIFPIMVTHLIERIGYGWAMRVCALLILVLLIIANLTVRARLPPTPRPSSFSPATPSSTSSPSKGARIRSFITPYTRPFKESDFLLLAAGFFALSFGIFAPLNYLPVSAANLSPKLTPYLLPILNAASLFGRLFAGFTGDKMGRYNIFIIVCYLSALWILALWIPAGDDNAAGVVAFAVLFGFSSGAYVSLVAPLTMQISPAGEWGFRTGMVYFVSSIGGLTTNPIVGGLIDTEMGYTAAKLFPGIMCVVGTTLILGARVRRTGWKVLVAF